MTMAGNDVYSSVVMRKKVSIQGSVISELKYPVKLFHNCYKYLKPYLSFQKLATYCDGG